MRRASGKLLRAASHATRIGSPFKPSGPTVVKFVKRELLDNGSVVWTFHKRSFDKLE